MFRLSVVHFLLIVVYIAVWSALAVAPLQARYRDPARRRRARFPLVDAFRPELFEPGSDAYRYRYFVFALGFLLLVFLGRWLIAAWLQVK